MSKPVTRIVLSVLISLALVAGIYMTVYGAAFRAGASSGRMQVTAGLLPDLSHQRVQAASASTSGYSVGLTEQKSFKGQGHDCSADYSSLDD